MMFQNHSTVSQDDVNSTSINPSVHVPGYADNVLIAVGSTIAALGFLGNTFTVAKIISDKTLHKTVYTAVACLAIADIICIILQWARLCIGTNFRTLSTEEKVIILSMTSTAVCSSAIHTIILSGIRCCMIVYPFTSRSELSSLKVIMMSLVGWILCILIGCFYAYYNVLFYAEKISGEFDAFVQLSFAVGILVIPTIFFLVFFILEYKALRRSLLPTINENKRRLTNMIKIVVVLYIICLTPFVITDILRLVQEKHDLFFRESYYGIHKSILVPVSKIFFILNPSVNPFIYFLYAKPWENTVCYGPSTRTLSSNFSSLAPYRRDSGV